MLTTCVEQLVHLVAPAIVLKPIRCSSRAESGSTFAEREPIQGLKSEIVYVVPEPFYIVEVLERMRQGVFTSRSMVSAH